MHDALDRNALDTIRAHALTIAHDAGALLLEGWRRAPRVTKKGAIDLVTDFDLRCEAQLRAQLAQAFPAHSVVAEEGAAHDGAHAGPVWYVDPIDGTTNFAHGHFFFAISLGLVVDGAPVVGVVHAPALGTTWHGAVGHGAVGHRAWRRGPDGVDVPCATSRVAVLDDALLATGFPYDRRTSPENNLREFAALKLRAQGIRRCGAASLDLCLVADGTYDGYWEQKLAPWDLAGGTAIVRAAGGTVTDYAGGALDVRAGRVVATNGPLHDALVTALAEARAPMSER